jgi:hypothetical protein
MDDETYQLLANLGDDLKAMIQRDDKTICFGAEGNQLRIDAFKVLAEAGVVDIGGSAATGMIYVTVVT